MGLRGPTDSYTSESAHFETVCTVPPPPAPPPCVCLAWTTRHPLRASLAPSLFLLEIMDSTFCCGFPVANAPPPFPRCYHHHHHHQPFRCCNPAPKMWLTLDWRLPGNFQAAALHCLPANWPGMRPRGFLRRNGRNS